MDSSRSRALTLRALTTFMVLDVAFRLLGFGRVYSLLLRRLPRSAGRAPTDAKQQAKRTFQAVQAATMFYFRRRKDCLPKALTTFHLLRRQGIRAELCFGVKKYPFSAHTWVEAFGESLDDDPPRLQHYTVIHRVAD
jgi:hypothetical protein